MNILHSLCIRCGFWGFLPYMFRFSMNATPARRVPTLTRLHSKLSPRLTGLPYLADRATRLGGSPHLSCKRDQNKTRNYMDKLVTPPTWVTSLIWGSPPLRACLHGGGGPQVGDVTRLGSVVNRPYFVSQTIPYKVLSQRFLA